MPKCILIHGGPWAKARLTEIAKGYDPEATLIYAFDWPEIDESGLGVRFRSNLLAEKTAEKTLEREGEDEVIARCRYLRALPKKLALVRIHAMSNAWADVLDHHRVELVISEFIDSYVPHILEKACSKRGITFHGMMACFVNGYCRTARYAELIQYRIPSDAEVSNILNTLTGNAYLPTFVQSTTSQERKARRTWARTVARMVWMGIRSLKSDNRIRNHVFGAWVVSRKNAHAWPRTRLGDKNWKPKLAEHSRPWIFVPLQHSPESTIDYWCDDLDIIDYDNALVRILSRLSDSFNIVVKEHPNVLGFRSPRLYGRLKKVPGLIFAPTDTPSSEIVAAADATLVWTGTVGFEAALSGKPVLTPTWPYYASGDRFMRFSSGTTLSDISKFIEDSAAVPITREAQSDMVRHLLAGLVPGSVRFTHNDVRTPEADQADRAIGAELAKVDAQR